VQYVAQSKAQSDGLISTNNGTVYMGVDYKNVATGSGRNSVRITSTKSYNHGLVILDLAHMPGGVCGTWPAFWMVGPDWPTYGEIDIIEGVNSQGSNSMTLHTDAGCSITNNGQYTGTMSTSNCNVAAAGQSTNAGCQIICPSTASYGTEFNAGGGGIYATEWTSDEISIWFFPRSAIPSDITSGNPDPTSWGRATAAFSGGCNIDTHFENLQIVFDTTFCGDWSGNVWSSDSTCSPKASTCQAFVQNNPSAFANAYWSVNSLKVYQDNSVSSSTADALAKPTFNQTTASAAVTKEVPAQLASQSTPLPTISISSNISSTDTVNANESFASLSTTTAPTQLRKRHMHQHLARHQNRRHGMVAEEHLDIRL
jgi:hypothetical protein